MEKSDKIIFTVILLALIGIAVFWSDVKTLLRGKSTNTEIKIEKEKKGKNKDKKKDKDKDKEKDKEKGVFNYTTNSIQLC